MLVEAFAVLGPGSRLREDVTSEAQSCAFILENLKATFANQHIAELFSGQPNEKGPAPMRQQGLRNQSKQSRLSSCTFL